MGTYSLVCRVFQKQLAFYRTPFCHRFLSQLVPRDDNRPQTDLFIQKVRSATHSAEIFSLVKAQEKMQLPQILQSMRSLFALQKLEISSTSDIVNNPDFETLCKRLRSKSRSLEFNDIVDILKILTFMGVSPNSEIYHIFLNLAKQEINSATLMQIVFLDFVFQKVDARKNPLIEALKMSFPILFQLHVSVQIDHENVPQLIDCLGFTSRNKVNRKTSQTVLNALILHGSSFSTDDARRITWSLCDDVNPMSEPREKLFNNVMDCLVQKIDDLPIEALEATLSKLTKKYAKHPNFYHERFLNESANALLERNVEFTQLTYFLKGYNRLSFVHLKLLYHMVQLVQKDPSLLANCRSTSILSFVGALSNANFRNYLANYRPVLEAALFQNEVFSRDAVAFPWTKLACDLSSLDLFKQSFSDQILSPTFLEKYLARESTIDYLQLLQFYQGVSLIAHHDVSKDIDPFLQTARSIAINKHEFPLQFSLEFAFGGQEYVGTKVTTKYHHLVDHILHFNENKAICQLNALPVDEQGLSLEELRESCPNDKWVAVMGLPRSFVTSNLGTLKGAFDLQLRTLEKLNLIVVPIDLDLWSNLPDREKIPFLQREIKSKL